MLNYLNYSKKLKILTFFKFKLKNSLPLFIVSQGRIICPPGKTSIFEPLDIRIIGLTFSSFGILESESAATSSSSSLSSGVSPA